MADTKIVGRGATLKQEISSVYTTIVNVKKISVKGSKSLTYPSHDLGTGQVKTKAPNGFSDPATLTAEIWHAPSSTSLQAFTDLIEAPVATNFKVTHSDATAQIFAGVGFGCDYDIETDQAETGSLSIETSGSAGWPT